MSSLPSARAARGKAPVGTPARYRLDIAARVLAASGGAYALAAAFAYVVALVLPLPRVDAVLVSTMLAFVLYAVAALWAFRCASQLRLWAGLLVPTLGLWAVARTLF